MAGRISDISATLDSQLKNKVKSFVVFSVALDESLGVAISATRGKRPNRQQ